MTGEVPMLNRKAQAVQLSPLQAIALNNLGICFQGRVLLWFSWYIVSMDDRFDWPLAFDAEKFLRQRMASFLERNSFARRLAGRMRQETGTDFFEWIDHLVLPSEDEKSLRAFGLESDRVETPGGETVLHHPRATLPRVLLGAELDRMELSLRPEFVAD